MAASCPYGDRPTERVSAASSARLKPIAGRGSTAGARGERGATEALPADIAANAATTPERFAEMVAAAKDYIAAGDLFQVVLSPRFSTPFDLPPFALYSALRRINPSPFLYFLDLPGFAHIGS